jgi:hypothetical protein
MSPFDITAALGWASPVWSAARAGSALTRVGSRQGKNAGPCLQVAGEEVEDLRVRVREFGKVLRAGERFCGDHEPRPPQAPPANAGPNRWKAALNAFAITFDARLPVKRK